MSRISLTTDCAHALEEARWSTRARCTGDLLEAALDGNEAALGAIAKGWPSDTAGERTEFPYLRAAVLERLAELAYDAEAQPARGRRGCGLLGIDEMLRLARGE